MFAHWAVGGLVEWAAVFPALITTEFTAASTADEVLRGIDLSGYRVVVTGGSSGIGVETARALVAAGAEVTLAVRNVDAGNIVADEIERSSAAGRDRKSVV